MKSLEGEKKVYTWAYGPSTPLYAQAKHAASLVFPMFESFLRTKHAHSNAQLQFFHLVYHALHCGLSKPYMVGYQRSKKTHREAKLYRLSVKARNVI